MTLKLRQLVTSFLKCVTLSAQLGLFDVQRRQLRLEFGAVGFQGGDHVFVGRGNEGHAQRTFALLNDRRRAPRPLRKSLQRAERRGEHLFAATGDFGGGGRSLRVEGHQLVTQFALAR